MVVGIEGGNRRRDCPPLPARVSRLRRVNLKSPGRPVMFAVPWADVLTFIVPEVGVFTTIRPQTGTILFVDDSWVGYRVDVNRIRHPSLAHAQAPKTRPDLNSTILTLTMDGSGDSYGFPRGSGRGASRRDR